MECDLEIKLKIVLNDNKKIIEKKTIKLQKKSYVMFISYLFFKLESAIQVFSFGELIFSHLPAFVWPSKTVCYIFIDLKRK